MSRSFFGYPHVYTIVNRLSDNGSDVIIVDEKQCGGVYLCEMVDDRTDSTWVFESELKYKGIYFLDAGEEDEKYPEPEPVAIIDLESHQHFFYSDDVLMQMHEKDRMFYIVGSDGSLLESNFDISFKKVK